MPATCEAAETHTPGEAALFAPAVEAYRRVFLRTPELEERRLPGGAPALLFSDWLLLYPTGLGDGWAVRTEGTRERFRAFPCLSKPSEAEKGCRDAAVIHLCYMESHRLFHGA